MWCGHCFLYTSFWLILYIKRLNNTQWSFCKWYEVLLSRRMWWEYPLHICPKRLPYPSWWIRVIKYHSYYWRYNTKYCSRSADAHFHNEVGSVLLSVFAVIASNTSFMMLYNLLPPSLPKVHNQQSLDLRWHSFSGCGRVYVSICFEH